MMVPQSNWCPSWMPNTSRNIATPDRATPSQSKLWLLVGSDGTSRHARTKPTIPTGMLMKKIHSQPKASTSTPPRSGPTSVATPAVAPQSAIAWPRRSEGKMRVMIAIVCGRDHRGAEALEDASHDQHLDGARQAAPQRGQREHRQAEQVEVLRAEPVPEPTRDQHRHGVRQQVGAGHPHHVVHVGLEVGDDRGRRHRHDRGVDQDHEEADAQRDQCGPGAYPCRRLVRTLGRRGRGGRLGGLGHDR